MKLTPEDFEKLETKELANIIRKLGAGKTLTKREEEKLAIAKAKQTGNGAGGAAPDDALRFAYTWDELARILTRRLGVTVTRKSLQNWRNPRLHPDLADKWPRCRSDGRKDVEAWMRFMFETGRHRADEILENDEVPDEQRTTRDWKNYREELGCREAERRIARGDNLLLVATELEIPIGATFAAVQTKLAQFAPRVAQFMIMKRDFADAEETLRDEMDAVQKDLNLADYIEPPIAEIANEFPFDDETAALYERVSFDGQDRGAFVDLIRRCVEEALRRIGRRVLAVPTAQSSPDPVEVQPAPASTEKRDAATPASQSEAPPESPSPKSEHVTRPRKRGARRSPTG